MQIPLNLELMKNPINWVIIILMLTVAGLAWHAISSKISTPTTATEE